MLSDRPGWTFSIIDGALWAQSPPVPDVIRAGTTRVTGHLDLAPGDNIRARTAELVAAIDRHEARELAGDNPHLEADAYAIGVALPTPKGPGFQPIPAIVGRDAIPSILTSARPLPGGVNWRTGVSWRSTQPLVCYRREYCGTGALEPAPEITKPEFYPYLIYMPYSCDWVTEVPVRDNNGDEIWVPNYEADALGALQAMSAWNVSRELWAGDTETQNPSLQNTAQDVSAAAGAVHPDTALGTLLEAYWDCTQEGGATVHAPIAAAVSLVSHGLARQVGDTYYGPAGSIISPGPGYPTTANGTGPTSNPNAGAGNVWMYVTGPVEYALDDPVLIPDRASAFFNRRMNRYEVTAQRLAIHRFDTACVFACKTYVPSPGQGEAP